VGEKVEGRIGYRKKVAILVFGYKMGREKGGKGPLGITKEIAIRVKNQEGEKF